MARKKVVKKAEVREVFVADKPRANSLALAFITVIVLLAALVIILVAFSPSPSTPPGATPPQQAKASAVAYNNSKVTALSANTLTFLDSDGKNQNYELAADAVFTKGSGADDFGPADRSVLKPGAVLHILVEKSKITRVHLVKPA